MAAAAFGLACFSWFGQWAIAVYSSADFSAGQLAAVERDLQRLDRLEPMRHTVVETRVLGLTQRKASDVFVRVSSGLHRRLVSKYMA